MLLLLLLLLLLLWSAHVHVAHLVGHLMHDDHVGSTARPTTYPLGGWACRRRGYRRPHHVGWSTTWLLLHHVGRWASVGRWTSESTLLGASSSSSSRHGSAHPTRPTATMLLHHRWWSCIVGTTARWAVILRRGWAGVGRWTTVGRWAAKILLLPHIVRWWTSLLHRWSCIIVVGLWSRWGIVTPGPAVVARLLHWVVL